MHSYPRRACAGLIVLAAVTAVHARAAEFPVKPIRILVGGATGGGVDITARILATSSPKT